jgi:uncharacterized protein YggE
MLRGTEKSTGVEGVSVFGSAVLRVPPDMAAVVVAVTRVEQKPDAAFTKARDAARAVTAYLQKAGVQDFGSSRATLANEFRGVGNDRRFVGYQAMIEFSVIARDLDRVDALITETLAAGANLLQSVTFQTSRLKELRAEARRRAVLAAREKAELYCAAAGVAVGAVVSIEDVNPEQLTGRWEGHTFREPVAVDGDEPGAMEPGAIAVSAAVNVRYRIEAPSST